MIAITNTKKFSITSLVITSIVGLFIFRLVWGSGVIQKTGDIEIEKGKSAAEIWRNLVDEGISDRTIPWKFYGRKDNAAAKIQAGIYHVEKGEKISEVVKRFASGDVQTKEFSVTFPEGFTVAQIAARFADRTGKPSSEFLNEATVGKYAEKFSFLRGLQSGRSLEGYLFPDTYRITPDDSPEDVIMRMLGNFDKKIPENLREEIIRQGKTLDEIINMASILEKEVQTEKDMVMVAGVLWKRISEGEGLYVDATLEYIVEKNGELTVQDLALDSPYNTRKYRGLPPTPINNPGLTAILAAIRPEASEYYYYLTAKDGTTIFAKTNDEHNRNKVKYLQ
ncbi:MAG: endolytic transglycosylase MltG [bacterium]|nr:endolytic transglycosylase MltG [bacterium]